MNNKNKIFLLLISLLSTNVAHAVIFKCTDGSGNITYSNVLKKVSPNCVATSYGVDITSPLNKIKGSGGALQMLSSQQKSRDVKRIEILSKELMAEEKELEWSKEQQKNVNVETNTDTLKKNAMLVELHQNNITALKRQIEIISSSLSRSEPKQKPMSSTVSEPTIVVPSLNSNKEFLPVAPAKEVKVITVKPAVVTPVAPAKEVRVVVTDKPIKESNKEEATQNIVDKFFGN